ncbi:MAG: hypothetical protein COB23_01500 [Methylophaga sp.]|nr:MAG: hypothetical protein COB23_01500 [Methylophaga sp.]
MKIIETLNTALSNILGLAQKFLSGSSVQSEVDKKIITAIDSEGVDVNDIVDEVRKNNYLIIPNVFTGEVLEKMRAEFRAIIDSSEGVTSGIDRHDGAICVRMKPFFRIKNFIRYPTIYAFYNSNVLRSITRLFYAGSTGFFHVSEAFVHETPETIEPLSGKLHWDRAQTLKYWVYLDDLPEDAGPMLIEPHSAARNRNTRIESYTEKKELIGGVDNIVETPIINLVALSAGAGSILVHDTDASHGASRVMPGYVRRIIRGHCRARL